MRAAIEQQSTHEQQYKVISYRASSLPSPRPSSRRGPRLPGAAAKIAAAGASIETVKLESNGPRHRRIEFGDSTSRWTG